MSETPTVSPEDMQALHELRQEANGLEEHDHLDDMQAEMGVSMRHDLGGAAVEASRLIVTENGTVLPYSVVKDEHDAGRSAHSGAYEKGIR